MSDETSAEDTGDYPPFDQDRIATVPSDPISRDLGNFALDLSALAELCQESSRRIRGLTAIERAFILHRIIKIGRDLERGIRDRNDYYEDVIREVGP